MSSTGQEATGVGRRIRIGTRGSQLALWQSTWVADRLRSLHPQVEVELVEIKTLGDRDRNSALATIGGTGLFTKEIQHALLDCSVDVAVHSLKDLPTVTPSELHLAAVPVREDVRDALIAPKHKTLLALPQGARVGTGSLRRRAMLLNARPDIEVLGLRGNVETRLNRALNGDFEAIVLAASGLRRLGLEHHVTEYLGPPEFLPAVGQGALGIETRFDDVETRQLLLPLDHGATRSAVLAERQVLRELEGGCQIPLGAYGRMVGENLALTAVVLGIDGGERVEAHLEGPISDPIELGHQVANKLLEQGAERILKRD